MLDRCRSSVNTESRIKFGKCSGSLLSGGFYVIPFLAILLILNQSHSVRNPSLERVKVNEGMTIVRQGGSFKDFVLDESGNPQPQEKEAEVTSRFRKCLYHRIGLGYIVGFILLFSSFMMEDYLLNDPVDGKEMGLKIWWVKICCFQSLMNCILTLSSWFVILYGCSSLGRGEKAAGLYLSGIFIFSFLHFCVFLYVLLFGRQKIEPSRNTVAQSVSENSCEGLQVSRISRYFYRTIAIFIFFSLLFLILIQTAAFINRGREYRPLDNKDGSFNAFTVDGKGNRHPAFKESELEIQDRKCISNKIGLGFFAAFIYMIISLKMNSMMENCTPTNNKPLKVGKVAKLLALASINFTLSLIWVYIIKKGCSTLGIEEKVSLSIHTHLTVSFLIQVLIFLNVLLFSKKIESKTIIITTTTTSTQVTDGEELPKYDDIYPTINNV